MMAWHTWEQYEEASPFFVTNVHMAKEYRSQFPITRFFPVKTRKNHNTNAK